MSHVCFFVPVMNEPLPLAYDTWGDTRHLKFVTSQKTSSIAFFVTVWRVCCNEPKNVRNLFWADTESIQQRLKRRLRNHHLLSFIDERWWSKLLFIPTYESKCFLEKKKKMSLSPAGKKKKKKITGLIVFTLTEKKMTASQNVAKMGWRKIPFSSSR